MPSLGDTENRRQHLPNSIGGDCISFFHLYDIYIYLYNTYSRIHSIHCVMLSPNVAEGGNLVSDRKVPKLIKIPRRLAKALQMQFQIVPQQTNCSRGLVVQKGKTISTNSIL